MRQDGDVLSALINHEHRPKLPTFANKKYGVKRWDRCNVKWYATYEEANTALAAANPYVLVEGDKE